MTEGDKLRTLGESRLEVGVHGLESFQMLKAVKIDEDVCFAQYISLGPMAFRAFGNPEFRNPLADAVRAALERPSIFPGSLPLILVRERMPICEYDSTYQRVVEAAIGLPELFGQ